MSTAPPIVVRVEYVPALRRWSWSVDDGIPVPGDQGLAPFRWTARLRARLRARWLFKHWHARRAVEIRAWGERPFDRAEVAH